MSGMVAAPSASTVSTAVLASTRPCVCACMCAGPRAASGTCSLSSRESPAQLVSGRAGVTVQLVPRGTESGPAFSVVYSSGKMRAVVRVRDSRLQRWTSHAYCRRCGQSGACLGKEVRPYECPRKKRELCSRAAPKPWSVLELPCPPISTTNPGSYSYSQPSSRAVGSWAGPVGRAGLTIAARDSRRAFGAVGLYVWRDLGSH